MSDVLRIGPHLLGRHYVPDDRDWTLERLIERAAAFTPSETIQAIADDPSADWTSMYLLWRTIKVLRANPVPGPTPTPTPPSPSPTPTPTPSGAVTWADPAVLNQGNFGTCVGNGWAGWGDAAPIEDSYTETDARAIYEEATKIENGSADTTYNLGSTVRDGAKAMQARRKLAAYAFGTIDQAKAWVLNNGPVVVGSDWTNAMFGPNAAGFVFPTGAVAGGHCYLMRGYDPSLDIFAFRNSWGSGWGRSGDFFMHAADFARLMANQGELCFALEL